MKHLRVFIVLIVIMLVNTTYAQKIGIRAGLNLSNMLWEIDGKTVSDDFDINPGFHIGAIAAFSLTDLISFEPGIMLSTKGFKASESFLGAAKADLTCNSIYLDIPLNVKAAFDLGSLRVFGLAGPYVGIGMAGKYKIENTPGGLLDSEEDIKWGSDDEDLLKKVDFGLTFGVGIEVSSFVVGANYGLGLANIAPDTDDQKIANRVIAITLGYNF